MLQATAEGFDLILEGRRILGHSVARPCLHVGRGAETMAMYRGNFDIEDRIIEKIGLGHAEIEGDRVLLSTSAGLPPLVEMTVSGNGRDASLAFRGLDDRLNRFWLTVEAGPDEQVWGGGEQMSYLALRGRRFPLWTSEPGVGRDKTSLITFQADIMGRAGGDYWNTNYPQPTFLSSRRYALHVETTAWSAFDFRRGHEHEIEVWEIPARIDLWTRPDLAGLVTALSAHFGRPPALPDWAIEGAIIGLKDGAQSFTRLDRYREAGAEITALWCEDWVGLRQTSFGARLFWNWTASDARYPGLKDRIRDLGAAGIRFLGYVNPYLCSDGHQFAEAERLGHLARTATGAAYLVDFGEFDCGVVDFTSEAACRWFEEEIIGRNMIDFGLSGWMADFGEYLPVDLHLADGSDARLMHNAWPVKWAEVNARAVAARGRTGDILFFMRAGFSGVQRHNQLLWAGDQCVDFSRHDGLGTVITGALSAGLVGNPYHHSDIGGYTSLFGNVRTAELIMRWAEMAAFTPIMRSHEGNRPKENLQIDGDPEVLAHFARMTRIHKALAPYVRALIAEAVATGLPLQRPLFLHYEADPATYAVQDAYLYGPDLLVAPVAAAGRGDWTTYLPEGANWRHLWSGTVHGGGASVTVPAPLGQPPVFVRIGSGHTALFESIAGM